MLRFFEPEANTRWLASAPPPPQLDNNAAVPSESPTLALGRSSSLIAKVNLMKNRWLPSSLATVADVNVSPSPSPDPSSAAANSSNAFGGGSGGGGGGDSGIFCHDAGGVLRRQARDPFPEAFRGGRSSSSMAVDTRRRSNQLDILDWRKRGSIVHEEENKKIAVHKRQKTSPDEKLYLLPSFDPSSPKLRASINQTVKEPVKNQKLGDKITALQQLVSPFGKTDTASVLQEATVYIKALHEQINFQLLSRLHFDTNSSRGIQGNGVGGRSRLNDRGLCIIPISSAILISLANQECADYSIRDLTNQLH